jgi:hypothetical protein
MQCRVETYSGFRLHERPRRFTWGKTWLEVQQVVARWLAPGYLYFKVRAEDGVYLLSYDQAEGIWEAGLIRSEVTPGR